MSKHRLYDRPYQSIDIDGAGSVDEVTTHPRVVVSPIKMYIVRRVHLIYERWHTQRYRDTCIPVLSLELRKVGPGFSGLSVFIV